MISVRHVDFDALPLDLLPEAKEHMRVEFERDDSYIRGCLARAIAEVEAVTNLVLNPSEWVWTPSVCDCEVTWRGMRVPKAPTRSVFWVGSPMTLVFHESTAYLKDGVYDLEYTVMAGYENKQQMPPMVMNPVLMIAATLYENRESVQFGSTNELPDMARRILSGLWRPSV